MSDSAGRVLTAREWCWCCKGRRPVSIKFAWYDLWVGVFIDRAKRIVYVCPLPCILVTIRLSAPARRTDV